MKVCFVAAAAFVIAGCNGETGAPATETPAATETGTPAAPVATPQEPIAVVPPITHEIGFAYVIPGAGDPDMQKLKIFEDGKELGPADSLHDDIRKIGLGRYSHYKSSDGKLAFYFSTSDNSDPNTNGRKYELR